MIKQILKKIPRKSAGTDQIDSPPINSTVSCVGSGNSLVSKLNVVKRVSSAVFPSGIIAGSDNLDPHLPLQGSPNFHKQSLFIAKLNFCNNNSAVNTGEILAEVIDFIASGSAKFTDTAMSAICKVCSKSLFRVLPPKCSGGEGEDGEPSFDPSWPQFKILYDLLLQFVTSVDPKTAKNHLDQAFISKLIDLFDSEDPREREFLKTILHRIYGKFIVHRAFIRKSLSIVIYRYVFETENHSGIAELLEILGSVITGFALPLKDEHKQFLFRVLLPLHTPRSIGVYHQQLTYCVVQFVEKEPQLASTVIKKLLKYWPVSNSQKEMMLLSEVEEILEITSKDEFPSVMVPLFRRIACCLNSSHYQIAERAHLLWNNENFVSLVGNNKAVIVPLVLSALERNCKSHWNQAVVNLSRNLRKMLADMDGELVEGFERKAAEEEDSLLKKTAEDGRSTWERLGYSQPATCTVAC